MSDEIEKLIENQIKVDSPTFAVTLTIYDWHKLLKELEYLQQICNRDGEKVVDLWEQIATQTSGKEQIVNGSWKHSRMFPEQYQKSHPAAVPPKVVEEPKKEVSWWRKLFRRDL